MTKQNFEEQELEEIGIAVTNGYFSGITVCGTTWSLEVHFDYEGGKVDE